MSDDLNFEQSTSWSDADCLEIISAFQGWEMNFTLDFLEICESIFLENPLYSEKIISKRGQATIFEQLY